MSISTRTYSPALPALPGLRMLKTYAAYPVWSGSTTTQVQFAPMPKKAAVKLWHRARDFDRRTRKAGKHGGAIGPTGLLVLHAMLFDFLNYGTGRLDPSYAAIARKANVCVRTVATAIARMRDLRILNWVRRCSKSREGDRFVLRQQTNAYAIMPESQWRGHTPPPEAPPPHSDTWGACPAMPGALDQAHAEERQGGRLAGVVAALETDPCDMLARALAGLGGAMAAARP